MRNYVNKAMEGIVADLTAGLKRLRKGYIDAAEQLLRILESDREYPVEFVVFRLTGYQPAGDAPQQDPIPGEVLRGDLLLLMLDVSDSFQLRVDDYDEPVYDTAAMARRFSVSTKTIQRWHGRGLAARRMVFTDGRRRIAFLESTVRWFTRNRDQQIRRSMKFSQMSETERQDIIRRARRMARSTQCRLSDVVRRLAYRTGRAMETIRYTIRKHDADFPDQAIFPYLSSPLGDDEKETIYRRFLRGVPVPVLAKRYRRTRGSVYRIINEMRARQLLQRPISYVESEEFQRSDAEKRICEEATASSDEPPARRRNTAKPPSDLPPYLRALYTVPLLTPEEERDLFRRYNYLKYRAAKLRDRLDVNRVRTSQLKRIEGLLLRANVVKNEIIRANLRLVVSIAKKHVGGAQTLFELISDGNVSLMRAVEKFDYSRGFRFSTYASWAIMRNFARSVPRERFLQDRFSTGNDEVLEITAGMRSYDPAETNLRELRESIDVVLAQLNPTERSILTDHYGLGDGGRSKTLEQLANRLDLSKERVRQIELQAIRKLRRILPPEEAGLLR